MSGVSPSGAYGALQHLNTGASNDIGPPPMENKPYGPLNTINVMALTPNNHLGIKLRIRYVCRYCKRTMLASWQGLSADGEYSVRAIEDSCSYLFTLSFLQKRSTSVDSLRRVFADTTNRMGVQYKISPHQDLC